MPAVPRMMKAVLLNGHGGFDQLEYREDVLVPQPGEGAVLVQIGAAGVNNTDINTRTGWYSRAVPEAKAAAVAGGPRGAGAAGAAAPGWTGAACNFPRIQGADGCGRIVAVGAGVAGRRIGERVLI